MHLALVVRVALAATWFVYGAYFKLMRRVPRHERIVARVVGARAAGPLTRFIGVGEIIMAAWVASAIAPLYCALAQTLAIVTMNAIELTKARDLLYAWPAMLVMNTALVSGAWYLAMIAPT